MIVLGPVTSINVSGKKPERSQSVLKDDTQFNDPEYDIFQNEKLRPSVNQRKESQKRLRYIRDKTVLKVKRWFNNDVQEVNNSNKSCDHDYSNQYTFSICSKIVKPKRIWVFSKTQGKKYSFG